MESPPCSRHRPFRTNPSTRTAGALQGAPERVLAPQRGRWSASRRAASSSAQRARRARSTRVRAPPSRTSSRPRDNHSFRHAFLSLAIEDAPELELVARSITHSAGMGVASDRYVHRAWATKCEVIDRLDISTDRRADVVAPEFAAAANADVSADIGEDRSEAPSEPRSDSRRFPVRSRRRR